MQPPAAAQSRYWASRVKYLLLGFFVFVIAAMPAQGIRAFLGGPFGIVDGVKMLNCFRDLSVAEASFSAFS